MLSPTIVLAAGTLMAHLALPILGVWTWLPVMLTYWMLLFVFIGLGGGRNAYARWIRPSQGAWPWRLVACLTLVLFLPTFLLNWPS